MRIRPAVTSLAIALAVAACAQSSPSASTGSGSPASETAEAPLPTAGELFLVTYLDDDGPSFGVRVDAVGPSGRTRPIATIDDLRPRGWDNAAPVYGMGPTVGPNGYLVVSVERNGGFDASDMRTMLVDATGAGRPTVEVDGALSRPAWSPTGSLLALDNEPAVIDSATGRRTPIHLPMEIELTDAWVADGTGWVAMSANGEDRQAGRVSVDGTFTPGAVQSFEVTGLERRIGAEGGTLSMAVSDGVGQSDTAIIEVRPEFERPCQCKAWARFVEPGNDPTFSDAVWDAGGTGLWLVNGQDANHWLSHLDKPMSPTKVADLPPGVGWQIRGISPDDRWIVLGGDETDPAPLILVDTAAGEARVLAQPNAAGFLPFFAGWVR
jgi:hypothetical protein